jgi:hypothetical protein
VLESSNARVMSSEEADVSDSPSLLLKGGDADTNS